MDTTTTYLIIALLIGMLIGTIATRLLSPNIRKMHDLKKDLEKKKHEMEQQKLELSDYFSQSAELLDSVNKSYNKLHCRKQPYYYKFC